MLGCGWSGTHFWLPLAVLLKVRGRPGRLTTWASSTPTASQVRRIAERLWGLSTCSITTVRSPIRWFSTDRRRSKRRGSSGIGEAGANIHRV